MKRLEEFRFADNPKVPQATIAALAEGSWIDDREVVVFAGRARQRAAGSGEPPRAGPRGGALRAHRARRPFVELGYLALPDAAAELIFQVISERNERGSLMVTPTCPSVSGRKCRPPHPQGPHHRDGEESWRFATAWRNAAPGKEAEEGEGPTAHQAQSDQTDDWQEVGPVQVSTLGPLQVATLKYANTGGRLSDAILNPFDGQGRHLDCGARSRADRAPSSYGRS